MHEGSAVASSTINEDRQAKWLKGRVEHGPVMVTDPLVEIYQECLDGINYAESLSQDQSLEAFHDLLQAVGRQMRRCAKVVKFVHRETAAARHWHPQEVPFK